jgi:hypothetical protein
VADGPEDMDFVVDGFFEFLALLEVIDLVNLDCVLELSFFLGAVVEAR